MVEQTGQAGAELITPQMELAGICALEEALGVLAPHQIVAQVYIAMECSRRRSSQSHGQLYTLVSEAGMAQDQGQAGAGIEITQEMIEDGVMALLVEYDHDADGLENLRLTVSAILRAVLNRDNHFVHIASA